MPFTGGGLGQFPAQYSAYIQAIPHAFFLAEDSGNSAYLNVLVEQGWLGLIALITLLFTSVYAATVRLAAEGSWKGLEIAGAIGLAYVVLYGLAHDMLVATRTIPFLLVPIGLVLARHVGRSKAAWRFLGIIGIAVAGVALMITAAIVPLQPAAAVWQANLGVVEMAKVELAEWPTGVWDDGSRVGELARAESMFAAALEIDPTNRTANHRMGLIRMLERDYGSAIGYLEIAHLQDPEHRGVQKALGQSYAWAGQLDKSLMLLIELPESRSEMSVYQKWWGRQNRPDLAESASRMVALLDQSEGASAATDL